MTRTRDVLSICGPILLFVLLSCSEAVTDPIVDDDEGEIEIVEGVSQEFFVDAGSIGIVVDTRPIFQKGYVPTEAEISFPDLPGFDAVRSIDAGTNLAILSIHNDSLTTEEKEAFSGGVVATITVRDGSATELAVHQDDALVLDDSNLPLSLETSEPGIQRPLILREGMPYLLQTEESGGLLKSHHSDAYVDSAYAAEDWRQQFYFEPVAGEADAYHILHVGYTEGTYWNVHSEPGVCIPEAPVCPDAHWIFLAGDAVPEPAGGHAAFAIEQDPDGWAKIRHVATGLYVAAPEGLSEYLRLEETGGRYRIISDDIEWSLVDRGTRYNQPIMPPAELEFAYSATLRNCSAATLEEQVGRAETRTTTNSAETSESLQLYASETLGATLTLGYKVAAKVGVAVQGLGEAGTEVEYSAQLALSGSWTTSETTTTTQSFTDTETTGVEVSRVRTLTVPPNTAVEVYDAVKTIRNVRVPFTQTVRITGSRRSNGAPLSGPELVTQMLFNFVGGLIADVGSDYVDVTLRGSSMIDQLMEATTDVNDLLGACD
jgi:hypothetical protein